MTKKLHSSRPATSAPSLRAVRFQTVRWFSLAALAFLISIGTAPADLVTLLNSDAAGTTSFTGATNWSNGQVPGAANDYFVPLLAPGSASDVLRTPTSATVVFAGNSLTVQGFIAFKGTNLVTVNDLRLTNGLVGNYSTGGNPAIGRLAGNINVITNGVLYAGGSGLNMQIFSTISGSGGLEIRQPSTVILSATNTYNGSVIQTGSTLELDGTGSLTPSSLTLQPYIATSSTSIATVTNMVLAGGSLNVGYGPAGVLRVGYRGNSTTNCVATLNVSVQRQFTVNVGEFSVGINTNSGGAGTSIGNVLLATNNFVAATNLLMANGNGASGGTSTMLLGGGTNYFNTSVMTIGENKESAQLTLPVSGALRLDNGANRTELTVGSEPTGTSSSPSSAMNLNGAFTASLDALVLGLKSGGSSGSCSGALVLSANAANDVNVNTVLIGSMAGAASGSPVAQGTLTIGGGNFLVNNGVTLASYDNSGVGSAVGVLNVNGGTFAVAGNIVNGGGTAILNLGGGVVDMQPAGAAAPGSIAVSILSGSGTIINAGAVAVATAVSPGSTNAAGTLTVSALDVSSGAALNFGLGGSLTVGSGSNDLLQVNGNLILNNNPVTITALSPLTAGTYRLINYTGSLSGNTSLTLNAPTTRQSYNLDLSTPGQVNLVVTGNAVSLLWSGDGSGNVWDVGTTANWDANADVFYQGDFVTFNDSGSAVPDINVAAPVQPGLLTVSNTVQAYVFDGTSISTSGSLTKLGNNVLALANSGNNFSGSVNIQAGTLSLGNGGTTGSLGTGAISNNGTLMFNNSSNVYIVNNVVSGAGSVQLTGGGAIVNDYASNSYTGGTMVGNGCQFNIYNNNALGGTNTGTVVQSGGHVGFTTAGNWLVTQPLTINGYGIAASPGALYANTTSNNATWAGPITVASPAQIRDVNTGVRLTLAGTVTANNQALQATANDASCLITFLNAFSLGNDPTLAAFTKDGAGTVTLAGNTNVAGSTAINAGTLLVSTLTAPQIGDIAVNGGALQIGSGANDGSLPTGAINLNSTSSKLIINSGNTFVLNNPLNGSGTLSVLSYGTVVINNANPSFTGNVTTGSGVPVIGGIISLSNSQGLGSGSGSQTIGLTHASLQLQGGLDIPSGIAFLTSGGTISTDIAAGLIPIHSVSGDNIIEGPITLNSGDGNTLIAVDNGTLTLNGLITANSAGRTLVLGGAGNGVINGYFYDSGSYLPGLAKQDAGTWTLNYEADYPGATTISGGTLALGAGVSIPNTPTILLQSNAVFDVSAIGGFTVGGNQTLGGNGTVLGDVTVNGTAAPAGTLNFSGALTLTGSTIMELNRTNAQNADLITAASFNPGGTLTITNIGPALQAGDTFKLFGGTGSGSFSVTNLPTLSATNLYWDVSQFGSQGIIIVGSTTATSPVITQSGISGGNLTLQVADSQTGYNYVLLATPQLAPASWTAIQTNAGGGTLSFVVPVASTNAQQFFRISVQ